MPKWLYYFDTLDSTNNYAMRLIDDGMAQHGNVIWTMNQPNGKGQRGKVWIDSPDNLKFSLIVQPKIQSEHIFKLSMIVAVTIIKYLKNILPNDCNIKIKWPNDIYINDKKTAGILIENTFRGVIWNFAVIGIGLNVNQENFPKDLTTATSLKKESKQDFDLLEIIQDLRSGILNKLLVSASYTAENIMEQYNAQLYQKNHNVKFRNLKTNQYFEAFVMEVNPSGKLVLLTPMGIQEFDFGTLEWLLN